MLKDLKVLDILPPDIVLPSSYSILLHGPTGVGKFEFFLNLASQYLSNGENVLFVTTEKSPAHIKELGMKIGADLSSYEGKSLKFLHITFLGEQISLKYGDESWKINTLYELVEKILRISEDYKQLRVLIDSLSIFFIYFPRNDAIKAVHLLIEGVKNHNGFIIFTLHEGLHDSKTRNTLIYLNDGYIQMKFDEESYLERKMRIRHLKGLERDPRWFTFDVTRGFNISVTQPIEEKDIKKLKDMIGYLKEVQKHV